MRQFFKILFACLAALILFCLIIFVSLTGLVAGLSSGEETTINNNSVLTINLSDEIAEQSKENSIAVLNGEESKTNGLNHIIKSIQAAKTDDKIKGIYLRSGISSNGWSSLQELRIALEEFKTSKKFIYSYGEVYDQKSYYVSSVADRIFLNPVGMLEFIGLSATGTFFKGTLDKLDVQSEAFHCGKYKGAYEPFKLDKYSEPNRYQLGVLLGDFYKEFLHAVAQKTGTDTSQLAALANEGKIRTAYDALHYKFIDQLLFADSLENLLRSKLVLNKKDKINFVDIADYTPEDKSFKVKDKIAVLYANGEIHDGEGNDGIYSKTFCKSIRKVANDDQIKAVVLRINSPGGSALASEIIYHELQQLKAKKPIVVSMGNYAASGGYYIACAADSIFANSNTVTGSIGVVGVLFNIGNMMKNKMGVTFDQVKTGQFADFPNMTRPMTDLERNWIQAYLDSTYVLFKARVADARKLSLDQVEELAQGHVYSGITGKSLQLVDAIGNKDRAIASAAKMAKLQSYRLVEYPKPVDEFEEIVSNLMGKKREDAAIKKILGEEYAIYQQIKETRKQENRIQMILPTKFDIR